MLSGSSARRAWAVVTACTALSLAAEGQSGESGKPRAADDRNADQGGRLAARWKIPPARVAVSAPNKQGLVTKLRPVVTQLAVGDPIRIALHFESSTGPFMPGSKGPFDVEIDPTEILRGLQVHITRPNGKTAQSGVVVKDNRNPDSALPVAGARQRVRTTEFHRLSTFFLELNGRGILPVGENLSGLDCSWAANGVNLKQKGVYWIRLSGSFNAYKPDGKALKKAFGEPLVFESEAIGIEFGVSGILNLNALEDIAKKHLQTKRPGAKPAKGHSHMRIADNHTGNRSIWFRDSSARGGKGGRNLLKHVVVLSPTGDVVAMHSRPVSTCVAAGTLIETERGALPVERLRVGQRIWAYDSIRKERVLTALACIRSSWVEEVLDIAGVLRVTAEHPIRICGQWKRAGDICPEDRLLAATGRWVRAGRSTRVSGAFRVFDLTVEAPHNFYANGFLLHNKKRGYIPDLDDPWYLAFGEVPPTSGPLAPNGQVAGARFEAGSAQVISTGGGRLRVKCSLQYRATGAPRARSRVNGHVFLRDSDGILWPATIQGLNQTLPFFYRNRLGEATKIEVLGALQTDKRPNLEVGKPCEILIRLRYFSGRSVCHYLWVGSGRIKIGKGGP
jgi:hypothetical protein